MALHLLALTNYDILMTHLVRQHVAGTDRSKLRWLQQPLDDKHSMGGTVCFGASHGHPDIVEALIL